MNYFELYTCIDINLEKLRDHILSFVPLYMTVVVWDCNRPLGLAVLAFFFSIVPTFLRPYQQKVYSPSYRSCWALLTFNGKNPYQLHLVCLIWKSPNLTAGTKPQYHPNAKTKPLPKEAVATRFHIPWETLLWSQLFLARQLFQQRARLD